MTFQLDTTGIVSGDFNRTGYLTWDDLSSFTQGYIKALFASVFDWATHTVTDDEGHVSLGFRHLAPEALARIIADCDRFRKMYPSASATVGGRGLWTERQAGGLPRFPPLTVQLGDDGKVRLAA